MNSCPLCESQYSDETLRFCLQDGTPLTTSVKQSSIETVAFTNPATVEKFLPTEEMRVNFFDKTQPGVNPSVVNPIFQLDKIKSKSSNRFWVLGLSVLAVLGAAGFGGWFYLNNQNRNAVASSDQKQTVLSNPEKDLPVQTTLASPEPVAEKTHQLPSTNQSNDQVKNEITEFINSWKALFEARNLPEYTSKYAEKVDYYEKDGATIKEISSEVQRIFTDFKEIEITLSNVRVAVDAEGDKATAIFDKEWSFETEKNLNEGKAHTKLQFEKTARGWKIVSEKILKTYYLEN